LLTPLLTPDNFLDCRSLALIGTRSRVFGFVETVNEASIRRAIAAMVQLQHLCGARPQEVVAIRPCEVDTSGDVSLYQPRSHRTAHLDRGKVTVLGPLPREGATALAGSGPGVLLLRAGGDFGLELQRLRRRDGSTEKTRETEPRELKLAPGRRFTRHSYRVVVQRSCKRAGIPA
jgi:hypothetical protein